MIYKGILSLRVLKRRRLARHDALRRQYTRSDGKGRAERKRERQNRRANR